MFAVGHLESEPDRDPDHDDLLHAALTGARTFMDHAGKFGLLSLYERRINRTVHKNMALLRQMQTERRKSQAKPFVTLPLPGRFAPLSSATYRPILPKMASFLRITKLHLRTLPNHRRTFAAA